MGTGDLDAGSAAALHRGVDRGPRGPPSEHEDVGVVVAGDLGRRDVGGDPVDLGRAQLAHALVVGSGV